MHALDERVLRDDEPAGELRRVVLDPACEPAPLELREQAELAELRQPHVPHTPRTPQPLWGDNETP